MAPFGGLFLLTELNSWCPNGAMISEEDVSAGVAEEGGEGFGGLALVVFRG
jgi:hypothetical protein